MMNEEGESFLRQIVEDAEIDVLEYMKYDLSQGILPLPTIQFRIASQINSVVLMLSNNVIVIVSGSVVDFEFNMDTRIDLSVPGANPIEWLKKHIK